PFSGTLEVGSGLLTFAPLGGAATIADFQVTGGAIDITGTLTAGSMQWSGGTIADPAVAIVDVSSSLTWGSASGASTLNLLATTVNLESGATGQVFGATTINLKAGSV